MMPEKPISIQEIRKLSEDAKEKLIGKIEQVARYNEVEYFGCSQVVLDALQRNLNIGDGGAFKAASALLGGVAMTREVCGALLGGVMAIGLVYGRANFESGKVGPENHEFLEARVRGSKLCDRFKEMFDSLRCADVMVSVGRKDFPRFNTVEAFEDHAKCENVTGPAARFAAEIILQPTELFTDEINALLDDIRQIRKEQQTQGKI
jgi:C_GCAxxG_C_C family probable redox protein